MSQPPFGQPNPYSSPTSQRLPPVSPGQKMGKVTAPAVGLLIVGCLGLVMSTISIVLALVSEPPPPDPTVPEWLNELERNSIGVIPALIQCGFAIVGIVIIAGSVMMLRMTSWTFALVASILSLVNFGSCCCVLGFPFGIWSIIILCQSDVQRAFGRR